jgi:predicted unusual protein kinase regulating ubiquinone biosynthesis (AarF/ABC1/UbiB family)
MVQVINQVTSGSDNPILWVPANVPELSGRRVMVSEWIYGGAVELRAVELRA